MSAIIRHAYIEDAKQVAPLIYNAIGKIANRLTGETTTNKILTELETLYSLVNNRHSYTNTYVATKKEDPNKILGILVVYSGIDGINYDISLKKWLENKNAPTIQIDQEAHLDEFYVDTISVHEKYRGLGIGTKLLRFAEELAKQQGYAKLSLNVEIDKISARRLYERVGFVVSEPWTIIDEPFHHMIKNL